ncbi:MAG TPA: hypothetical protein VJZ27_19700, partial [Aggregatilineales bacterium]|nr:hypothetical protein [Aggregatilineales bacterium]
MSTAQNDSRIVQGMKKQLEIRRTRLESGIEPLGWKVGFGAPSALQNLNIDAPLIGFLTADTLLPP